MAAMVPSNHVVLVVFRSEMVCFRKLTGRNYWPMLDRDTGDNAGARGENLSPVAKQIRSGCERRRGNAP